MKKSPLVAISVRNGLIAGILAGALLIALYFIGTHPMHIMPYADFRVLLFGIFIFFTLKEFRDNYQEGALYFIQGMLASLIFVTVVSVVAALGVLIFSNVYPEFVSDFVREGTEMARSVVSDPNLTPEEKTRLSVMMESLPATNGKTLAGQHFFQSLMIGFFISIILSVILRKQASTQSKP